MIKFRIQLMLALFIPIVGYMLIAISIRNLMDTDQYFWLSIGLGIIAIVSAFACVSYLMSRSIRQPIQHITRVAKQINSTDASARLHLESKGEWSQIGQAMNQMADLLQHHMNRTIESEGRLRNILGNMISGVMIIDRDHRIVSINAAAEMIFGLSSEVCVGKQYYETKQQFEFTQLIEEGMYSHERIRDEILLYYPEERILDVYITPITQTDGTWSGLLIVLDDITAVRRLERMRSEFVANVSHELKTPLAAVKGFAETLLSGALQDRETAESFIQIIFDESERLNRLIGDILELSKIESKRIPLQFSPIHLSKFIINIFQMMNAEAQKKKIILNMQIDDKLYIEADEDRLRQILINLISNGINYTPEEGKVTVVVTMIHPIGDQEQYQSVQIKIIDTGIGIPKRDLPRIFERFYRVDKARSRLSGGTGLGLSIVKHLVELHNGHISVESKVGIGTEFMLELPIIHENY